MKAEPAPRRGRLGWWLLSLGYAAAIYALSSVPNGPVPLPSGTDKIAHFLEYAGLAFVLGRASGSPLTAFTLAALWGASDEVHQAFVPGREAGLPDWWADLAGAALGAWLSGRAASRAEG